MPFDDNAWRGGGIAEEAGRGRGGALREPPQGARGVGAPPDAAAESQGSLNTGAGGAANAASSFVRIAHFNHRHAHFPVPKEKLAGGCWRSPPAALPKYSRTEWVLVNF